MTKKTIEDKLRRWYEVLSNVLWGYRNPKSNATSLTPYRLTYGQDAMLQLELVMNSFRVARQLKLQPEEYSQTIFPKLESADEDRLMALENI